MISRTWTLRAACTARPELPWTTDTVLVPNVAADAMRAVCASCSVVADCLAAVDHLGVTGGWWAGIDRDPDAFAPDPAATTVDVRTLWRPLRVHGRSGSGAVIEQGVFDFGEDGWLGGVA